MLPSPSPLRTGLVAFTTSGSSLANACCGRRGGVTYECDRTCTYGLAKDARGGMTRDTQARAGKPLAGRPQVLDEFLFFASTSRLSLPQDHAEVCTVARHRDVVSATTHATVIPPITGGHSLAPRSSTRPPVGFPCGRLATLPNESSRGEGRAYHVPR